MIGLFQKDEKLFLDSHLHKNAKKLQCKAKMRVRGFSVLCASEQETVVLIDAIPWVFSIILFYHFSLKKKKEKDQYWSLLVIIFVVGLGLRHL